MIAFEKHIKTLLSKHDCVAIPGFGAFILRKISAEIQQHFIAPPAKIVAFNPNILHDDGLLISAIIQEHGLSFEDAQNKLTAFGKQIQFQLERDGVYKIVGVGTFSMNNGQVLFKSSISNIIDKNNFGLTKTAIKPIAKEVISKPIKLEERKSEFVTQIQQQKDERKKSNRTTKAGHLLGLSLSILLFVSFIGLMFGKVSLPAKVQQAGFIDLLFPNDTFIELSNPNKISTQMNQMLTFQREGEITGQVLSVKDGQFPSGYFIVVGSYASKENAIRMEQLLFEKGNDSYILSTNETYHRVGVYVGENYIAAKDRLAQFESFNQGVWLIKNF